MLFFESYSILQIVFLWRAIRRARRICFHEKIYPPLRRRFRLPRHEAICRALIRLINREVEFVRPPEELLLRHNWEMNKRAIPVTDRMEEILSGTGACRALHSLLKDDALVRFFQGLYVSHAAERLMFYAVGSSLRAEDKGWVLVPAWNGGDRYAAEVEGGAEAARHSAEVSFVNGLREAVRKLLILTAALAYPLIFVLSRLIRGKVALRPPRRREYDVLQPVLWGIFEAGSGRMISGTKKAQDDSYLQCERLSPDRILYLFRKWRRSLEEEADLKAKMARNGWPFADSRDFVLTPSFLRYALRVQWCALRLLAGGLAGGDGAGMCESGALAVRAILHKRLEIENVACKVEFVRDDYNAGHVIETILNNRAGRLSIGIQHHMNAWDYPALSYVHFDKYIVYGDLTARTFRPHWDRLDLQKTGRENIDWAVSLVRDREAVERIAERLDALYGKRRARVLFVLPTRRPLNRRKKWDELYAALEWLTQSELEIQVFLRFRSLSDLEASRLARFRGLAGRDPRVIIDQENFTTQELMAAVDVTVGNTVSFSIWEAAAAGRKVFSFDMIGVTPYYFAGYGKDFVLTGEEALRALFRAAVEGLAGLDVRWEDLARDCNYHADGGNLRRIQEVVVEGVAEVNGAGEGRRAAAHSGGEGAEPTQAAPAEELRPRPFPAKTQR